MGHNLLLSLFIWMLKISQLWPVKVFSIWLVSFWHAHIILWVLPEFLWKILPFSKPWQKSALLRGSLVSFDWAWCLDTKIQVLIYSWILRGPLDYIFLSLKIFPITFQPTAQSKNTNNLATPSMQIFTFLISALYSLLCNSIFFNSSYFCISSWLSCLHVVLTDSKLYDKNRITYLKQQKP